MKFQKKGDSLYLVRRVPKRYYTVEDRRLIWLSLNTDSESVAKLKAPAAWDELLKSWEARLDGRSEEADVRYKAAREIAKRYGFKYLPVEEVAELPTSEIVARVNAAHDKTGKPNLVEAAALLGTVKKPTLTMTAALETYWPLAKDKVFGKSEDQIRRWRNPRIKAFNNFVNVVGNLEIAEITPDNMLDFRDWLMERIESGEIKANSANKDLIHIAGVLRLVNTKKRLGLNLPLSDLSIAEGDADVRPAFSEKWIREKLLAPGALDGLNPQARAIFIGMINTGYRPSEACVLTRDQIFLDHDIPHIRIEPVGRTLKSKHARRVIPLLGVSLEAFRAFPDGFPRYRDKATVSETINIYLKRRKLKETPDHTPYSLRHSFQERMIKHDVDDRIRRDVFGHALTEERYGEVDLVKIRDVLMPLAI